MRKLEYNKETYYDRLMKLMPESNFTLDEYIATEKPAVITCNSCNTTYTFKVAANIARRAERGCKNVCKKCENNKWAERIRMTENNAKEALKNKGTIKLVGAIKTWGSSEPVEWLCTKCNHTFFRSPCVMFTMKALNCPWCESRPYEYTEEIIKIQTKELWGDEYTVLKVNGVKKEKDGKRRILVRHNKCGFIYEVNHNHFLHGQGCPRCRKSKGEMRVKKYLEKHNFDFQEQYSIHTKTNRILRLDFYLEKNNKKFAIEYNGIQHYQPIDWFDGEKGFKEQCIRDEEKIEYCKENNIELIIIPYNDESIINSESLAQRLSGQVTE